MGLSNFIAVKLPVSSPDIILEIETCIDDGFGVFAFKGYASTLNLSLALSCGLTSGIP